MELMFYLRHMVLKGMSHKNLKISMWIIRFFCKHFNQRRTAILFPRLGQSVKSLVLREHIIFTGVWPCYVSVMHVLYTNTCRCGCTAYTRVWVWAQDHVFAVINKWEALPCVLGVDSPQEKYIWYIQNQYIYRKTCSCLIQFGPVRCRTSDQCYIVQFTTTCRLYRVPAKIQWYSNVENPLRPAPPHCRLTRGTPPNQTENQASRRYSLTTGWVLN